MVKKGKVRISLHDTRVIRIPTTEKRDTYFTFSAVEDERLRLSQLLALNAPSLPASRITFAEGFYALNYRGCSLCTNVRGRR